MPAAWQANPEPSDDPDLVFDLLRSGDAELLIYLEDAQGRTLDGLWMALRYAVVIDWGGSLQGEDKATLDGAALRLLTFTARTAEHGTRRYLRGLAIKNGQKLTVQLSAPPAAFPQVWQEVKAAFKSWNWRAGPSEPSQV